MLRINSCYCGYGYGQWQGYWYCDFSVQKQ